MVTPYSAQVRLLLRVEQAVLQTRCADVARGKGLVASRMMLAPTAEAEAACVADVKAFPDHLDLFNKAQILQIIDATASVLDAYGYHFSESTKRLELHTPTIKMESTG